jgi:peptidoglycan/LPS O-acetylase OafA/YrhL
LIFSLTENKLPFISAKTDKIIGEYSYPIYLIYWQAGFVASMLIWSQSIRGMHFKGGLSFLLGLTISVVFSYVSIKAVDIPIENIRRKIKKRNLSKVNS